MAILASDHSDRVPIKQEASRTPLGYDFGVEHVDLAKAQIEALAAAGVLMQKEPKV